MTEANAAPRTARCWAQMTPTEQAHHLVHDHGFGASEFAFLPDDAAAVEAWAFGDPGLLEAQAGDSYPTPAGRTGWHDGDHEGGEHSHVFQWPRLAHTHSVPAPRSPLTITYDDSTWESFYQVLEQLVASRFVLDVTLATGATHTVETLAIEADMWEVPGDLTAASGPAGAHLVGRNTNGISIRLPLYTPSGECNVVAIHVR